MEHAHPGDSYEDARPVRLVADATVHRDARSVSREWASVLHVAARGERSRLLYVLGIKRVIDVMVSAVLLVALSPLLIVSAIAIMLDSRGPVLYRQTRVGRHGDPFTILKFRTMTHAPSSVLVLMRDDDGTLRHKIKHDPRVTHVGKWLRRTSIDELPQLVNILRGEMSLVGPRPELPEIVSGYEAWQHQRHLVRPGLTGWWQVSGRSDRPMHENTHLDIYYIEHLSFWLDARIALRTIRVVLSGLGAF